MAEVVCLHAKEDIERCCRRNPFLHIYALGDLDDFFWPHTTWFGLRKGDDLTQLVLLYTGQPLPVLLACAESPVEDMREMLAQMIRVLPHRFYAHLSVGVANVLAESFHIQPHGLHHKMALRDTSRLSGVDASKAVRLSATDTEDLIELYEASYPGNWFVPRMLETGFYFGIRRGPSLASVAGVHVYSSKYKVAALGNITTRPDARGQGLATVATARLCQELLRTGTAHVGLNVKADNPSAITCYQKLGFDRIADYGEYTLEHK